MSGGDLLLVLGEWAVRQSHPGGVTPSWWGSGPRRPRPRFGHPIFARLAGLQAGPIT